MDKALKQPVMEQDELQFLMFNLYHSWKSSNSSCQPTRSVRW